MIEEIKYRESKFSWSEIFSDSSTGKSSSTILAGILCIFVGLIGFITCFVLFFHKEIDASNVTTIEGIYQSIILITIGAALLGVRNLTKPKKGMSLFEENHDDIITEHD